MRRKTSRGFTPLHWKAPVSLREGRCARRDVTGFTFIEILAAMAIIGISLVTLIGLEVKTIRLQQVSNRTTIATLLAQEKMIDTLKEIRKTPSPSLYNDSGDFEDEDLKGYHWEYTLSTTPAEDLYRIDLMVYWNPEDKEGTSVTLTSFLLTERP